jgi:hypothetical protein
MAFEYSPILRAAVAHDLLLPAIAALAAGYFAMAFIALRSLEGSRYYLMGVLLVLLISATHFAGGLSWIILNPAYSNAVLILAMSGVIFSLSVFLLAVKRQRGERATAA